MEAKILNSDVAGWDELYERKQIQKDIVPQKAGFSNHEKEMHDNTEQ